MSKFKLISTAYLLLLASTFLHAETTLHEMHGQKILFSTLKGKWVLINYWASWCQSCLEEIPELNRFYAQNKHKNIALFAVNYDALPRELQQQLIKQYNIHYPALLRDPAQALHLGEIRAVPVTFIFNPDGELSNTLYGKQSIKSLVRNIFLSRD